MMKLNSMGLNQKEPILLFHPYIFFSIINKILEVMNINEIKMRKKSGNINVITLKPVSRDKTHSQTPHSFPRQTRQHHLEVERARAKSH